MSFNQAGDLRPPEIDNSTSKSNFEPAFRGNPAGNKLIMALARGALRLFGWRLVGLYPEYPKFVAIGAPHTSNWDFILAMLIIAGFGVRASWMAKHTLFRPPFGWFFYALGGIPIDRSSPHNVVEQAAAAFAKNETLIIGITPEGTRSRVAYWKSGFYHLARLAEVPIVMCYFDYGRKQTGLGDILQPSGNIEADMEFIKAFYTDKMARHPDKFGQVRVKP